MHTDSMDSSHTRKQEAVRTLGLHNRDPRTPDPDTQDRNSRCTLDRNLGSGMPGWNIVGWDSSGLNSSDLSNPDLDFPGTAGCIQDRMPDLEHVRMTRRAQAYQAALKILDISSGTPW